jgi:hypothetical protein
LNKFLLTIVSCILCFNSIAIADVYVQAAETLVNENIKVGAGTYSYYRFSVNKDEQLKFKILVSGGSNNLIDVRLLDMQNFQKYAGNQQYSYFRSVGGSVQREGNFEFIAPKTDIYYLVLDNRMALLLARNIDLNVIKIANAPTQASLDIQKVYEDNYAHLKELFIFNDFNINIKTCGVENAFSNPDITMCIELIDSLKKQNLSKAVNFVFFHEVSHSLLNTWGYPTNDNEDVADEFATVLTIFSGHEDEALEAAQYWSEQSSKASAISKLYIDDRHTISPQRARNIINWLNRKPELLSRWINLLLPKMTNQSLIQITKNKNLQKDNPFSQEIERRKLLKEWDNKS